VAEADIAFATNTAIIIEPLGENLVHGIQVTMAYSFAIAVEHAENTAQSISPLLRGPNYYCRGDDNKMCAESGLYLIELVIRGMVREMVRGTR
jgi:hypothetical protein